MKCAEAMGGTLSFEAPANGGARLVPTLPQPAPVG